MKLSDAMVLGDTLAQREPTHWVTRNYEAGCAIGRALLAIGIKAIPMGVGGYLGPSSPIYAAWPWLNIQEIKRISDNFTMVCLGLKTFEELVEHVRKVEPECGACNKYQCTCQKTAAEEPVVELTTLGGA